MTNHSFSAIPNGSMHQTLYSAPDGLPYNIIRLQNNKDMQIQLMDWGATWISCQIPVNGELREVLLGCQAQDYSKQSAYLGASIGRYANRIANASYQNGECLQRLNANQGAHQLHGGTQGFDKARWKIAEIFRDEQAHKTVARFTHFSPNGDQGFVGDVQVSVRYELYEDNSLVICYEAQSDADTPLNLTNHAYFNLQNAEQSCDVRDHYLQINADYFLPVDREGIPNAPLKSVNGNSFDFRQRKTIAQDFLQQEQQVTKGYDHSFLLNQDSKKPCAILTAPDGLLSLEVRTSQPALQVYTGNYLNGTPTRSGGIYTDYSGVALETQALPDTPNHPEWWQYGGMVKAGEKYCHWTKFSFKNKA